MKTKIQTLLWGILLVLVFFRPFLSEYAFVSVGFWYVFCLILCSGFYLSLIVNKELFLSGFNYGVAFFTLAILFSLLFSGYVGHSLYEFYFFIPNIIFFYIANKIKNKQQKQLIGIMFFSTTLISIYGIYQYFIGFNHVLKYLKQSGVDEYLVELVSKKRIFAVMTSPNIFVSYIAMMLFVAISLFNMQRKNIIQGVEFQKISTTQKLPKSSIRIFFCRMASHIKGIVLYNKRGTQKFSFLRFVSAIKRPLISQPLKLTEDFLPGAFFCGLAILAMAIALLLTKSLGGILAFVVTFFIFLLSSQKTTNRLFLRGFFLICVLILISGFFTRVRIWQFFDLDSLHNSMVQRFYY